ncbi:hypothetical protein [Streptomyces sp. NPDC007905]|uniref:hypothetical protein n=1 Tax=Streptomyces sp. NPDC007905 TaxID=3364788 RepID=UPI0036E31F29
MRSTWVAYGKSGRAGAGSPSILVLIGPAGSGKSTLASIWGPTQILSLNHYRALVSDSFSAKFSMLT